MPQPHDSVVNLGRFSYRVMHTLPSAEGENPVVAKTDGALAHDRSADDCRFRDQRRRT